MTGFGRAAVRRDARSDARHVTAMKLPKVTCRSLTDTRPELCLQRRACQMPRSMAARACGDAAVAHVLATGGGVRDAVELAAAYLQRSGHPPRSDRTLICLVRENSAFRRASAAMAHAAERVAAARILAGEPQWFVARTSRVDLAVAAAASARAACRAGRLAVGRANGARRLIDCVWPVVHRASWRLVGLAVRARQLSACARQFVGRASRSAAVVVAADAAPAAPGAGAAARASCIAARAAVAAAPTH